MYCDGFGRNEDIAFHAMKYFYVKHTYRVLYSCHFEKESLYVEIKMSVGLDFYRIFTVILCIIQILIAG